MGAFPLLTPKQKFGTCEFDVTACKSHIIPFKYFNTVLIILMVNLVVVVFHCLLSITEYGCATCVDLNFNSKSEVWYMRI